MERAVTTQPGIAAVRDGTRRRHRPAMGDSGVPAGGLRARRALHHRRPADPPATGRERPRSRSATRLVRSRRPPRCGTTPAPQPSQAADLHHRAAWRSKPSQHPGVHDRPQGPRTPPWPGEGLNSNSELRRCSSPCRGERRRRPVLAEPVRIGQVFLSDLFPGIIGFGRVHCVRFSLAVTGWHGFP